MKKNSKRKSNLKSSLLLLLLLAILLISSSYAWFTANQTVTVSSLNVNVQASNGLQISADGTTWKAVLSNSDLTTGYATAVNQIPTELAPVSTTGIVTNGKMDMFYGTVEANAAGTYMLTATQETDKHGASGRYIAFDLFLKVDKETQIYMTTGSKVEYAGETDQGLQNAARVAFVNEGTKAASSAVADIQAMSLTSGTAMIWEPNYDTHTANGLAAARDIYGKTITKTTGEAQQPYYGIKKAIPDTANITMIQTATPSADYFSSVSPTYKTISGHTDSPAFLKLTAGVTKLRVYMWIEGQDVDCENNASGTNINFDLQFTATPPQGN